MPIIQLQFRRGTSAEWASANPVLASGEPAWETDTGKGKVGDGTTAYTSLTYKIGVSGGGGGDVISVNGETGVVVLTASEVGASATGHTHTASEVTDLTETMQDLMNSTILAGTNVTKVYNDAAGTLTLSASGGGAVTSVNGQTGAVTLTKSSVGLGSADNTSDLAKPVSGATQDAIDTVNGVVSGKAPIFYRVWSGISWPARPTVPSGLPVTAYSTTDINATAPTSPVVGDVWVRHPDAT